MVTEFWTCALLAGGFCGLVLESFLLSPIPPPLAELSQEGICLVISVTELKAVGIMKPDTLAHLSLFRDESAIHCDGQQDNVHY